MGVPGEAFPDHPGTPSPLAEASGMNGAPELQTCGRVARIGYGFRGDELLIEFQENSGSIP